MVYVERMGGWSEGSPIQSSQKGNGVSSRLVVSAVSKALIGLVQLIVDTKLLAPYHKQTQAYLCTGPQRGSSMAVQNPQFSLVTPGLSEAQCS